MQLFWENYSSIFISAGVAILIWLLFFVISQVVRRALLPRLEKALQKKPHPFSEPIVNGAKKPLGLFLFFCGIYSAFAFLFSQLPQNAPGWLLAFSTWFLPVLQKAFRIFGVVTIAWWLVNASKIYSLIIQKANNKLNITLSKSMVRFLSAIFNVVVIAFAAVLIITEFGYNVSALVTGLGLGGLTIALAAKDSAANFFGGLVLVTERPFEIGDWIAFDGVEGTVEDINLRSTKIRTGPGSLTIVPNATISNAAITNWSGGMEKRRANFKIPVSLDTQENKIKEYLSSARTMLETDPEIISDSVLVRLAEIGNGSMNIQIVFYTSLPGYNDFMRINERINFSLLNLAHSTGVTFAYPTQMLYILQPPV